MKTFPMGQYVSCLFIIPNMSHAVRRGGMQLVR